jgi:hypothetical protein
MSYVNAGPIVFTPTDTLDSPNDAVTDADFDNLVATFDVEFDTAFASLYCYIGTVAGPDVMILRLKPDGTNLLATLTEKYNYTDTVQFTDSPIALALNTVATVKITHDAAELYSVYLDDVLIDSATHSNALTMGDGVFHLGYFDGGTATVTNINVGPVVTPAIVSHEEVFYLGQGYCAINAEGIPTSTYYGADIGGEDAVFVARNDPYLIFQLTDEINALTANDPADDPATQGYEVRIWYGD